MPMGQYANFAECVSKNRKKRDPKGYCGAIKHSTEDKHAKEGNLSKNAELRGSYVIDAREAQFSKDETSGKMYADLILIKAGRAKNPRNYRASALVRAAKEGVYNGARMFVDHGDKPPLKRSLRDMVSAIESTTWDPKIKPQGAIKARAEIFDEDFFTKVQKAKNYMGVSANHKIGVTYIQEGRQTIEDVHWIPSVHSVDWVVYPSAGGEIVEFARESEGAEQVEWTDVTLDQLKANAPAVLAAYRDELIKQAEEETDGGPNPDPKDDDDDDADDDGEELKLTRTALKQIVQEQVQEITTAASQNAAKVEAATKRVRDYVAKTGLTPRTQTRIINQFAGRTEYIENDVKEAVEEAKAELKEAGAGPRITGMGPTSGGEDGAVPVGAKVVSVREAVEAQFGNPFKKPEKKD